ncbi:MAG TPA: STAS domain-containing protein [Solirubrobacteraceae bacterium]|jgi:anti-anti-sigma factor
MSDDGPLRIAVERTGTTVRVAAEGEIDISTVERLREATSRELAADGEIVVVDLTHVSFIDSSGLHAVLDAASRAPQRLRIIPGAVALTLFTITGVADRLPLVENHADNGLRPHRLGNLNGGESGPGD